MANILNIGSEKYKLYSQFVKTYLNANPAVNRQTVHQNAQKEWNNLKNDQEALTKRMISLQNQAARRKNTLDAFFLKAAAKPSTSGSNSDSLSDIKVFTSTENKITEVPEVTVTGREEKGNSKPTRAQDEVVKRISLLESEIVAAKKQLDSGIASNPSYVRKKIKEKEREQLEQQKRLKKLKMDIERQSKSRQKRKMQLKELAEKYPDEFTAPKEKQGRPSLEETQPDLLETIKEIAKLGGAADDRRRSENIRLARTLDDLVSELKMSGYQLSRSAAYLRLIPHRWNTSEGKRHVTTVPVKLAHAQKDDHKTHEDSKFAAATIRYIHQLASVLGPDEVIFISQDDKARVPIGITAANKQAPMLMSMEYRVKLPDHDWVVAERHKLIPSVYAVLEIQPNMIGYESAVTYSGPTYVAIRSGKHDSSSAYSHGFDLCEMLELEEMKSTVKLTDGNIKPVMIVSTDGGPDENPRYPKTLQVAAYNFKEYNLDAVIHMTNAPGRSAFNPVERRMAPLSHDLAGLILPHDHYGSHLDVSGKTADEDLEKKNFLKAGTDLAEIWSRTIIDNHPVMAAYISPDATLPHQYPEVLTEEWKASHVRESQYCLQIAKCDDLSCCRPYRSSLRAVLPDRFLPPPIPVIQTKHGLVAPEPDERASQEIGGYGSLFSRIALAKILPDMAKNYKILPFDMYCPSLLNGKLPPRICNVCGIYFSSIKSKTIHSKKMHARQVKSSDGQNKKAKVVSILRRRPGEVLIKNGGNLEWVDEEDIDTTSMVEYNPRSSSLPVISSVQEWLQSPWTIQQ